MPLNTASLRDWRFAPVSQRYTDRDTMLYALSVGFGIDATDPAQLPFVYEKGLRAVPSMAAVLCHLGAWLRDPCFGVTMAKVVHGEQRMIFHRPLAPEGELVAHAHVAGVQDKGEGKGALVHVERVLSDVATGEPVVTIVHTTFCRADGGCESFGISPQPHALPARAPDRSAMAAIRPDAALLYRLNVDRNPLHADPACAQRAGFPRPILHGLCTYGIAARALLLLVLDGDPSRLLAFDARFSSVVYPGETLQVDFWFEARDVVAFRACVPGRDATVLDNGRAVIRRDGITQA
ncbi:MaoC/PaaZ C-terminal domain-containing protein [Candidimonas nitroreducens]|uniref:3-alpha,7-alpha, 12-alpha-trihydroxy-5-beta-cholest-24-enoyl-CoA hydratase n=1 Tax=Candidimonas nitroreducens TaxID=683354 RepID=A0A225MHK6_9BURK|nr:MaoC/PaaZ C-terminal domain-containing protein [Candidimonas nitroreducens]OWT58991.1 3-alpha,7-alpha,12-alpha-trihydroxy-5-beta-cholest-24-enoyl-CoA hydratase [Candidimonas nitroreducens]